MFTKLVSFMTHWLCLMFELADDIRCVRPSVDKVEIARSEIAQHQQVLYRGRPLLAYGSYLHMPIALIWNWWTHNLRVVATKFVGCCCGKMEEFNLDLAAELTAENQKF